MPARSSDCRTIDDRIRLVSQLEPDAERIARSHGSAILCRGPIVARSGFGQTQGTVVDQRAARGLRERRISAEPTRSVDTYSNRRDPLLTETNGVRGVEIFGVWESLSGSADDAVNRPRG